MSEKICKIGTIKLVNLTVWLSYIFGLWPRNDSTIIYTIFGGIYQTLTTFAWAIAKAFASMWMEDKNDLIMYNASSMYCGVAAYRTFIFMKSSRTVDSLLNFLSEFKLSKAEYDVIQPKLKMFSRLSTAYTSFIFSGLISALLNPVLSSEKVMPVPIWLPYVYWKENDRDFYIALTFSVMGILSMVIVCAFTPIVVWYLICGISLMLKVLDHRLQLLGTEQKSSEKNLSDLTECIKLHQTIFENIKKVEDVFASVFLLQITSSAICICSIAYIMASEPISGNLNNFTMYCSLGGIYILEIFILVYLANEIIIESDRLNHSIYCSNWTCMSVKWRKLMLVIIEIWKKPQQMLVGKIFIMRIQLLTSILNLAYSILNVLRKDQH